MPNESPSGKIKTAARSAATPSLMVGLLPERWHRPWPPAIEYQEPLPASKCCRLSDAHRAQGGSDPANVHLFAAYGTPGRQLIPISRAEDQPYPESVDALDGPSLGPYEDVKTVDDVYLVASPTCFCDNVWLGELICVESITMMIPTSDGERHIASMPIAVKPWRGPEEDDPMCVYVTQEALEAYRSDGTYFDALWYLLGGCLEDEGSEEEQRAAAAEALGLFAGRLVDQYEPLRRQLLKVCRQQTLPWSAIHLTAKGELRVERPDGDDRTISPDLEQQDREPDA